MRLSHEARILFRLIWLPLLAFRAINIDDFVLAVVYRNLDRRFIHSFIVL